MIFTSIVHGVTMNRLSYSTMVRSFKKLSIHLSSLDAKRLLFNFG